MLPLFHSCAVTVGRELMNSCSTSPLLQRSLINSALPGLTADVNGQLKDAERMNDRQFTLFYRFLSHTKQDV